MQLRNRFAIVKKTTKMVRGVSCCFSALPNMFNPAPPIPLFSGRPPGNLRLLVSAALSPEFCGVPVLVCGVSVTRALSLVDNMQGGHQPADVPHHQHVLLEQGNLSARAYLERQ